MPIYEYRCKSCQRRISIFFRSFSDTKEPCCTHCGSSDLSRLISSFTYKVGWADGLSHMPSFESLSDFDEDDPSSVEEMLQRFRQETGDGLAPGGDELLRRTEAGETPEDMSGGEWDA